MYPFLGEDSFEKILANSLLLPTGYSVATSSTVTRSIFCLRSPAASGAASLCLNWDPQFGSGLFSCPLVLVTEPLTATLEFWMKDYSDYPTLTRICEVKIVISGQFCTLAAMSSFWILGCESDVLMGHSSVWPRKRKKHVKIYVCHNSGGQVKHAIWNYF